jgi:hypothetical protein
LPWGENDLDDARWAQAGVEILTALIEAYFAYGHGSSLNYLDLVNGARGMTFLSLLGLGRIWLSYRVWTLSPQTDFSRLEAWTGVTRALPDATAFARAWAFSQNPLLRRLQGLKMAIDTMSHAGAAVLRLGSLLPETQSPLAITQVPDKTAALGKSFSLQLQATGGWEPYSWQVEGLPTGLVASSGGLISGTPTQEQMPATVSCQVKDGFLPPVTAEMTFKMRVK